MKELKDFTKEELLEVIKVKNHKIKELEEEISIFRSMADKLISENREKTKNDM